MVRRSGPSPGVSPGTRRRASRAQTPEAINRRRVEEQRRVTRAAAEEIAEAVLALRAAMSPQAMSPGLGVRPTRTALSEFDLMGQRGMDSSLDEFDAAVARGAAARRGDGPQPQQGPRAEFSGLPFWAQGNVQQSGGWLQGLANNLGGEAVGMAMGVPSFLQLAGQTAAYPIAAGLDAVAPRGSIPDRFGRNIRESTEDAWQAAGSGIAQDYATRWGPLFRGDIPEFGRQVYRNPGATLLDLTGAGALVGRAPNVAARATARTAPAGSALRARAERFTSIRAPGEALLGHALPDGMAGNRYRPDKVRRGTAQGVTKDKRTRVESAEVRVPQRPYSANVITRGAQKAAGRAAESVGRRAEAMADRLQVADGMRAGWRPRAAAAVTRPLTGQAKFNRAQRKAVRELVLRRNQEAAAAYGAISRDYNRAVSKLQRDKNAAGVQVRGLGTEHLATRLHLEGILTPRAGVSPVALRDMAVARMRRGIEQRRKNGERVEAEAIQVERLASIPADLLELKGNAPAVRRVREAVEAGRKLDRQAQDFEVESGVVTQATREGRQSLPSRVLLAGQDDAEKVIARLREEGRKPEARELRVAATADDPKVVAARGKLEKAEARLAEVSGKADRTAAMARVKDARRAVREAEANQRWQVAGARRVADRKRAAVEKQRRMYRNARAEAAAQAKTKAENARKAARPAVREPSVREGFKAGRSAERAEARHKRAMKPKLDERAKRVGRRVAELEDRHRRVRSAIEKLETRHAAVLKREAKDRRASSKQSAPQTGMMGSKAARKMGLRGSSDDLYQRTYTRNVRNDDLAVTTSQGRRRKNLAELGDDAIEYLRREQKAGVDIGPEYRQMLRDYDLASNLRSQLQQDLDAIMVLDDPFGGMPKAELAAARARVEASIARADEVLAVLRRAGLVDEAAGLTGPAAAAAKRVQETAEKFAAMRKAEASAREARSKYQAARVQAARVSAKPVRAADDARLRAGLRAAERDLAAALREVDRVKGQRPAAQQAAYQRAREELAAVRARLGGTGPHVKAATRKRDKMKRQYDRVVDEALEGALTPPTRPQLVGHDGVYIPHIRPTAHRVAMTTKRGMRGPAMPKRSKGNYIADGILDWNPALLSHQARRATDHRLGPISREALAELIDIAAFTDDAGRAISGPRALRLAQTDPDQVALVSADGLRKALSKLDELEPGRTLTRADIEAAVIAGKETIDTLPKKGNSGKYVAISKAAADEFLGTMRNPQSRWRYWDAVNDYWKGAILALSPRWYVNSTFGAGMQYGILTGGDLWSIRRANRKGAIRDAIPNRDAINTLAQDVGFKGRIDANGLQRAMTRGFEINNKIETTWRRAAYLNRAQKHLKNEGVRTRGLSDAEIAHAISTLPPTIARQITREIDLFMGEFRKFSRFEQEVMRRVIPFYSWLRVITKLTLSLPFRSPARAEALMVAAKMGTAGINPGDWQRPWYDRGAWTIPGTNIRVRTSGWNSLATLVPVANALGAMSDGSGPRSIVKELGSWTAPGISSIANYYAGYNTFGSDVFAKGGGFTADWRQNPVTGEYYVSEKGLPVLEAILQATIPGQAGPLRRALAAGDRPYDTTSTFDLLRIRLGLKSPKGAFYEARGKPVNAKVGPGGAVSGAGGFLGFPVVREDARELERRQRDRERDARRSERRREREERRG